MAVHKVTGDGNRKINSSFGPEVVTKASLEESLAWNPFLPGALNDQSERLNPYGGRVFDIEPGQGTTVLTNE